jgi:hypothetical protein
MARFIFGSARFTGTVTNNANVAQVGGYDVPSKLVTADKDVCLCLPTDLTSWGLYPTHQDAWLLLAFVVACHSRHEDEVGLSVRRAAWAAIPAVQWAALAAKAAEFATEFRIRLADGGVDSKKLFKSLTRALQDCLLYLGSREFPEDHDVFLAASPVAALIEEANRGRRGDVSVAQGLALADSVDALVARLVAEHGGLNACRQALAELTSDGRPGRVVLLPAGTTLEQGAALLSCDVVIGVPDAHDMDFVSVVSGLESPRLVQLKDGLSGQRLDIIAVPPELDPADLLESGHEAFQSVAEMVLANGTPRTANGAELVARLSGAADPVALAVKYRRVAREFFGGSGRKSWASRRMDSGVAPVKKVIPLYRIACDLLPRALFMERTGRFPGGAQDIAQLAEEANLGDVFRTIRSILDRQDASQEQLEGIAAKIAAVLQ